MIALTIRENRLFMAALLAKETFDRFLLREASLTTFCTYTIDGTWQDSYFDRKEAEAPNMADDRPSDPDASSGRPRLTPWSYLRPHFYDLIKGQFTPLGLRIVFQYPEDLAEALLTEAGLKALLPSVYGLYLNLKYDGERILLTTGSAQQSFPPDHEIDRLWDNTVRMFLDGNGFAYEDY